MKYIEHWNRMNSIQIVQRNVTFKVERPKSYVDFFVFLIKKKKMFESHLNL